MRTQNSSSLEIWGAALRVAVTDNSALVQAILGRAIAPAPVPQRFYPLCRLSTDRYPFPS
ncbi:MULTISPECIES: hypothetical protein [unclassified Leptolyngbya]|uniref:hypothetical protein n=1 Tax=unclassified Leptolyngbya TaxID=2650499 RepID=UPI00198A6DF4|nr:MULTISPECIES: hypothetical protein [unclassified Leptolyngbya]MBD2155265.1 hypothetical protein [Leptolyngbya sp. FACHB-16]